MKKAELVEVISREGKMPISSLATPGIVGLKTIFNLVSLAASRRIRIGPGDKVTWIEPAKRKS